MKHLPLTNKHLFTFESKLDTKDSEILGYLSYSKETNHFRRIVYLTEGISINWKGNPFSIKIHFGFYNKNK